MLEELGISETQAHCYEQLIAHPHLTVDEFAARLGLQAEPLGREVDELQALGLVSRSPDSPPRLVPAPPEVAIAALVHRRRERLERARLYADRLMQRYRNGEPAGVLGEYVEVIRGRDTVSQRFQQLQQNARREMTVFVRPPYVTPLDAQVRTERRLLAAGVRIRGLYDRAAFERAGGYQQCAQLFDEGEEARVLPAVPMKLAIVDRCWGLVTLRTRESDDTESAALVGSSGLLDALNVLADTLWEQAVPISDGTEPTGAAPDVDPPLTARDREILLLLQAGLTDHSIGRQLGLSERTVGRRVRRLMDTAGADTRFQLGWRAGAAGWLEGCHPQEAVQEFSAGTTLESGASYT